MPPPETEKGRATREDLVARATVLFAERGYEATSIEALLEAAGVSRGALYHHFASKEELFDAVFVAVEGDVTARVAAAVEGLSDPLEILMTGAQAWVELAADPVVQRIVILDAAAVLGWERFRDVEEAHALGMVKLVLAGLADQGRMRSELVDVFAHVFLAALNEIALLVAKADDKEEALRTGRAAVDELVARLID